MGFFNFKNRNKKETEESITPEMKAALKSVEEINKGSNLDDRFEEAMKNFDMQEKQRRADYVESQRIMSDIDKRLTTFETSPSRRRIDSIAREEANRVLNEMSNNKEREFYQKYYKVASFLENLKNGKVNDNRWEMLPPDIKNFTFYSYFLEKSSNDLLSDFEKSMFNEISRVTAKYVNLARKNALSLGTLVYLGLLDFQDVSSFENPKIFENVLGTMELDDFDEFDDKNRLGNIISNVVEEINNRNGKIGLVDEYFSGRIPLHGSSVKR